MKGCNAQWYINMKIYEIISKRTMIRKDLAERLSKEELNDNYFNYSNYEGNILFYSYEESLKVFKIITNDLKIKLVKGYFGMDYYALSSVTLSELIVDDNVIDKEKIERCGGLNNHKLKVYENTLVDNIIKEKSYTIKDLKNYIKEGK